VRLVNMYGITETTVHVTFRELADRDLESAGSVIGRPLPDLGLYVLDRYGEPVPAGVGGELYVGGAGLARGYLGRPELTAERFVPDPFGGEPGARLYRTGDLARPLADGDLEYLGRADQQVKIRGFRIELGEIEAALASGPGVAAAVVAVWPSGDGDQRLVGYVVAGPGETLDPGALRRSLEARLPEHMVPVLVELEALPLTVNGKVDRRALPAPDRPRRGEIVPPRTRTEEVLLGIWKEVLGLEEASVEDGFFELGGHSLLATRALTRIQRAFDVEVTLRELFMRPTVAGLAGLIDERMAAAPVQPVDEGELADLLDQLDLLSDDEVRRRLEELHEKEREVV
jgi:acyl carrier protein